MVQQQGITVGGATYTVSDTEGGTHRPGSLTPEDLERIVNGDVADLDDMNRAARQQIALAAENLMNNNGAIYGENSYYNASAQVGDPKCNILVRDAQSLADAPTPKFSANEWGNARTNIPGWSPVQSGPPEPGDVVGFARYGVNANGDPLHGHVGIVAPGAAGDTPDVIAANRTGVGPTQIFWNPGPNAGPTVIWRWNGM